MTFIKSSLTELMSIYIPILLIFSPLQAQSQSESESYQNSVNIVSWRISTSDGETFEAITVQFIGDDTLKIEFIDYMNFFYSKSVAIRTIDEIKVMKNNQILKKALQFGLGAFVISEGLGALAYFSDPDDAYAAFGFIIFPIVFVPPALVIGAIFGAFAGKDKIYKFIGNSDAEKFQIIQKILND